MRQRALGRPEDLRGMLIGVMDIVFTFGGQVNWMRYIISMRTPSKFPLAVAAVSAVMTAAYVGIGSIGCAPAARTFVTPHVLPGTSLGTLWQGRGRLHLLHASLDSLEW